MKTRMFALFANSLVLFALVVTPVATPAISSPQATFTVTTNSDVVDFLPGDGVCETATGNGMCTLRAAIMEANALIGEDIIELPAATYKLTIPGADEDLGATGDLDITESVTITGTGYMDTVIDAINLNDRVIHVLPAAGIVTIAGVIIQNGLILNHTSGGILNFSDLTLEDVYFYLNRASMDGGAISNYGELNLKNVTLYKNSASMWGGGIYTNSPIFADGLYLGYNTSDAEGGGLFATTNANLDLVSAVFNLTPREIVAGICSSQAG